MRHDESLLSNQALSRSNSNPLPFASTLIPKVPHPAKRVSPDLRDCLTENISRIRNVLQPRTYRLQKDTSEHDSNENLFNSVLVHSPLTLV
jgi:hypothetical protein